MSWRHAARLLFVSLGVAMIVVALLSHELSYEFKITTILLALVVGAAIGLLGDGREI